jgi:D-arginine dehydrogenase
MGAGSFDIVIVGGGIAGLSLAGEIAPFCKVAVLEREAQPGYHSTGRSAALFFETYGSGLVRALTRASRSFYERTPAGFAEHPLLETCGALFVARADQMASLESFAAEEDVRKTGIVISRDGVLERCPILRSDYIAAGLWDPAPASIDVASLLDGYRRRMAAAAGLLVTSTEVTALARQAKSWRITTGGGEFEAGIVVNAAGAWADELARLAGAAPVGLEPRRRTAVLVRTDGVLTARSLVIDVDEQFYFRAESGDILVYPADETPAVPADAQPEELDVAIAIDRFSAATTLNVRGVRSKWAGLRSFVADRNPVLGFDPNCSGFFWLAGQGGYGIRTAPAMSQLAAALVLGRDVPAALALPSGTLDGLSPSRFGR